MRTTSDFRHTLRDDAAELAGLYPHVPLPIGRLCQKLGVRIIRSPEVKGAGAYMYFRGKYSNSPEIRIPKELSSLPYARFCVAHELGHYLIYKKFSVVPEGKSEYWQHEEVCDEFARRLLMPDAAVSAILKASKTCDFSYIRACQKLATIAQVPLSHAAMRIADKGDAHYLRLKRFSLSHKVSFTTFAQKAEFGRHIKPNSKLDRFISSATSRTIARETFELHDIRSARLRKFDQSKYSVETTSIFRDIFVSFSTFNRPEQLDRREFALAV